MISEIELMIILRALIAGVLGFIVGWQRESCGSAAGDRTFALVAVAAASLTAFAASIHYEQTTRVIAGLVTGIGFLGGGMIMHPSTGRIRGLTTAASLWTVTSIGVLVGAGLYLIGVLLTLLVLLILTWDRLPIVSRLGIRGPRAHSTRTRAAENGSRAANK